MALPSKRDGKSSRPSSSKSTRAPKGDSSSSSKEKKEKKYSPPPAKGRSRAPREEKPSTRGSGRDDKPRFNTRADKSEGKATFSGERRSKPVGERPTDNRSERPARSERPTRGERPVRGERPTRSERPSGSDRPSRSKDEHGGSFSPRTPRPEGAKRPREGASQRLNKPFVPATGAPKDDGLIRLNRFLSQAGIASRREADRLIELGLVTVNGEIIKELGQKVDPLKDVVKYDDVKLRPEKMRYVLLNKPKDYITTMDDPRERKTVMALVKDACPERIYPVGRLDRATTGLLLFTNDGELAKRLTHPKHGYPKIYHVETMEKVKGVDLEKMRDGLQLEDGFIQADEVAFVGDGKDPHQVGIRIHSGKNRIVRRIFEHLGYTVKKLDRVMFAGLTKKDLPRGRHRQLTEQEINFLRMIR
jgi:23S rRNA pseudouridine2605 synthase